jgi:predicted RNA binding protein YcfA (HicA-like mRNA interferase family)
MQQEGLAKPTTGKHRSFRLARVGLIETKRGCAPMKVGEVIRLIEQDGWFLVATRGSHRQYKHPAKPGRVTVAGKSGDDMAPGTRASVFKQAGLKERT